jgi:hypothetical protein
MVCIHVDDFLVASSCSAETLAFKAQLRTLWSISDLGPASFCVGIAISRNRSNRTIDISQTALIDRIVQTFEVTSSFPISTPMDTNVTLRRPSANEPATASELVLPYRSLVGSLMYLSVGTRPDLSYAVSKLTQFLDCFRLSHWTAALRVVRYLLGTRSLALRLGGMSELSLVGFSDSSYADCPNTCRSCMGYCFSLGSGVISWSSRKQKTVACSTTDAEYISLSEACREAMWLRLFTRELSILQPGSTLLLCDNNGARILANDPLHHARSKHIDVQHHYVRERVESLDVIVKYVPSADNIADIFTKGLPRPAFERLRGLLGLH